MYSFDTPLLQTLALLLIVGVFAGLGLASLWIVARSILGAASKRP